MDVVPTIVLNKRNVSGKPEYFIGLTNPYYDYDNYNNNYYNNNNYNKKDYNFPYYVEIRWGDKAVFSDARKNTNGAPYVMFSIQNPRLKFGVNRYPYTNLDKVNLYFYTNPKIDTETGKRVYLLGIQKYYRGESTPSSLPHREIISEEAFHKAVSFLEDLVGKTVKTLKENQKTKKLSTLPENVQNKIGEYLVGSRFQPGYGFKYGLNDMFGKKERKKSRKNRRNNRKTRRSNK